MLAAVGVVTDICRAMTQPRLGTYMQTLMELLYKALRTADVHYGVKPQLIAAFGDAALALGTGFVDVSYGVVSENDRTHAACLFTKITDLASYEVLSF